MRERNRGWKSRCTYVDNVQTFRAFHNAHCIIFYSGHNGLYIIYSGTIHFLSEKTYYILLSLLQTKVKENAKSVTAGLERIQDIWAHHVYCRYIKYSFYSHISRCIKRFFLPSSNWPHISYTPSRKVCGGKASAIFLFKWWMSGITSNFKRQRVL